MPPLDLRPPVLVVAERIAVDPRTHSITISGVRHFFETSTFPHSLSLGIYLFAGSLPSAASVEIFLVRSMTDDSRSLWAGRLEANAIELSVALPKVTFPEPGFFDFQAYLDGRRHAWTRVEVRRG